MFWILAFILCDGKRKTVLLFYCVSYEHMMGQLAWLKNDSFVKYKARINETFANNNMISFVILSLPFFFSGLLVYLIAFLLHCRALFGCNEDSFPKR